MTSNVATPAVDPILNGMTEVRDISIRCGRLAAFLEAAKIAREYQAAATTADSRDAALAIALAIHARINAEFQGPLK